MALFVIILNFLWWNIPKFSQHIPSCRIRILNTEKDGFVKAGFLFLLIYVFSRCEKTGLIDFSEKRALTKVKHLLPVCQVSQNFTEGNTRKFCQFCFLCSCWRNKISKNTDVFLWARADYLSFRSQRACDRKTIRSHLNTVVACWWPD